MFESFGSDHPYFGVPVTKEGRAWLLNVVGADAILFFKEKNGRDIITKVAEGKMGVEEAIKAIGKIMAEFKCGEEVAV